MGQPGTEWAANDSSNPLALAHHKGTAIAIKKPRTTHRPRMTCFCHLSSLSLKVISSLSLKVISPNPPSWSKSWLVTAPPSQSNVHPIGFSVNPGNLLKQSGNLRRRQAPHRKSPLFGPWQFVLGNLLPPDLAKIPYNGPKQNVKVSFPEMVSTPRTAKAGQAITATLTIRTYGTTRRRTAGAGPECFWWFMAIGEQAKLLMRSRARWEWFKCE